jgi:hypothetical protein
MVPRSEGFSAESINQRALPSVVHPLWMEYCRSSWPETLSARREAKVFKAMTPVLKASLAIKGVLWFWT